MGMSDSEFLKRLFAMSKQGGAERSGGLGVKNSRVAFLKCVV